MSQLRNIFGPRYTIRHESCADYLRRMGCNIDGPVIRPAKRIMVSDIQEAVARQFQIPLGEMKGQGRAREVARPRQVAMYLAKNMTVRTLPEIGRLFGDRDHTTVMHACRRITELRAQDAELDGNIRAVEDELAFQPEESAKGWEPVL